MGGTILMSYSPNDMKDIIREIVVEALQKFNAIRLVQEEESVKLLTRKEAMEFLKVGSTKFNELRQDGYVTPIRIGKRTMYDKQDLIDLCDSLKN